MNCYETIDLMDEALEGRLAPAARARFDEHLDECRVCRTYLDQLRVTIQALERLPRASATDQRRSELLAAFKRELGR